MIFFEKNSRYFFDSYVMSYVTVSVALVDPIKVDLGGCILDG